MTSPIKDVFDIAGPFEVPIESKRNGRIIDKKQLKIFWDEVVDSELADSYGCYVFAIRAARGALPVYVGKTAKSFRQECLTLHKLEKVNGALLDRKRGKLELFLLPLQRKRGRVNGRVIGEAEKFLIQNAVGRNPELANVHGTDQETWGIKGVLRSGNGRPSELAREFRTMMGM